MTYAEKLRDPRWQKKRLELLEAANWKCQSAACFNTKENATLEVHHRVYLRNTDPWDYPDYAFQVLCSQCHDVQQAFMEKAHLALARCDYLTTLLAEMHNLSDDELMDISGSLLVLLDGDGAIAETSNLLKAIEDRDMALYKIWRERQREGAK